MNELRNSCRFTGNVGQDPELKYLPSGTPVVNSSIAVSMAKRNAEKDGYEYETTWIDFSVLGRQAETFARLVTKGTKLSIDATYNKRSYKDKEGNNRVAHNFTLRSFDILSPLNSSRASGNDGDGGDDAGYPEPDEDEMPF